MCGLLLLPEHRQSVFKTNQLQLRANYVLLTCPAQRRGVTRFGGIHQLLKQCAILFDQPDTLLRLEGFQPQLADRDAYFGPAIQS